MYDYCRYHCIHIGTELSTMTFYQFFLIINPNIYLAKKFEGFQFGILVF